MLSLYESLLHFVVGNSGCVNLVGRQQRVWAKQVWELLFYQILLTAVQQKRQNKERLLPLKEPLTLQCNLSN